jgi:HD-GYP domain-containing protein (c-di-GMP phosphodiesterase class II)
VLNRIPTIDPLHNDTIRDLLRQMEAHSIGEAGHAERVAVYCVATGERLGMGFDDLVRLRQAAALHDVGKITLDRALLQKLGELSTDELNELRMHAQRSKKVIESLTWLEPALPMIVHHHERWDGHGYPDGLAGKDIPLGARIIAVAEVFDTLVTGGGWRFPISDSEALIELDRCSGHQFDPEVVVAFIEVQPLIQPVIR